MKFIYISVLYFAFQYVSFGQSVVDIYVLNYTEIATEKPFIRFYDPELLFFPLDEATISRVQAANRNSIYFTTYNKRDSSSTLWKYTVNTSTISPILKLKVNISDYIVLPQGIECILHSKGKTYILRNKHAWESPQLLPLQINLSNILSLEQHNRITVDNAMQLCRTDTSYTNFQILSDHVDGEIYSLGKSRLSFIYKFSKQYWYLKEYDLMKQDSRILVQLPKGIDDYTTTPNGNFLCYNNMQLYAFNPNIHIQWKKVKLPFSFSDYSIEWMEFIGNGKAIVAIRR